jgi:hypothetical protein
MGSPNHAESGYLQGFPSMAPISATLSATQNVACRSRWIDPERSSWIRGATVGMMDRVAAPRPHPPASLRREIGAGVRR